MDVKRQIYNYLMENYIQEEFAFAQLEITAIQKFEVFEVFKLKWNKKFSRKTFEIRFWQFLQTLFFVILSWQ